MIRASSAIPGFYRSGVSLEGINYLDGGISDAIPVKEAARQGAKNVGRHPHCAVTNVLHAAVVQTHGTLAG
ncbi:patatin-like phospholipase family protein [Escherichia coli]